MRSAVVRRRSSVTFTGTITTWKGASGIGQTMPASSWFCSIAAAMVRVTPMP